MTDTDTKPVVLVGVDGSESSKDALRWAANYAELTGGRVRAVITHPSQYYIGGNPNPELANQARGTIQATVTEVLGADPAVPITTEVYSGHAAQVLVEASRKSDLLVVGSRGHGAFVGMFLGSVSSHCAHLAKCPVLVLRSQHD